LYRLLGRLLSDGLLEMGEGDGRRQYYSLSRLGRKVLKADAQRLAGLVALVRSRKLLREMDS
jgi:DNA-binding PadR family transcriptional regulator